MRVPLSLFQLTLPRGERRSSRRGGGSKLRVSTHAPAWGATACSKVSASASQVSTHAPAWGATDAYMRLIEECKFQLTLPRGERLLLRAYARKWAAFQLTLPRGERREVVRAVLEGGMFQLTLPRGERLPRGSHPIGGRSFNSRSRVGSDPSLYPCVGVSLRFNSRSRVGSDSPRGDSLSPLPVSTHAPAWGATLGPCVFLPLLSVSTHAPAWGATAALHPICKPHLVSTHAPAWGATGLILIPLLHLRFQLTLPRGERHVRWTDDPERDSVSTHAPAWGATSKIWTMESLD